MIHFESRTFNEYSISLCGSYLRKIRFSDFFDAKGHLFIENLWEKIVSCLLSSSQTANPTTIVIIIAKEKYNRTALLCCGFLFCFFFFFSLLYFFLSMLGKLCEYYFQFYILARRWYLEDWNSISAMWDAGSCSFCVELSCDGWAQKLSLATHVFILHLSRITSRHKSPLSPLAFYVFLY